MTEERCVVCERAGVDRREIEHEETGTQVSVCWECLRSRLRAKAPASDEQARRLLARDAERFGWQVWTAENVVYLLPELGSDARETAADDAEPMVDVTHG